MPRYLAAVHVDGESIRSIRDALGLTQGQLAAELAVTRRTVIRWELAGATLEAEPWALNTRLKRLERLAARAGLELVDVPT